MDKKEKSKNLKSSIALKTEISNNIKVEKLRSYKCQNFTSILNNPKVI